MATKTGTAHGHGHGGGDDTPPPEGIFHETRDAHIRPIVVTGAILIAVCIVTFVLIWVMLYALGPGQSTNTLGSPALVETPVLPPEPRLQQLPYTAGEETIRAQTERLEGYGWVDQPAGRVHIPIDEAMKLLAERGLPTAAPTAVPTPAPNATPGTTPTARP
ncbi:MAG: hypothetical protein MUD01_13445 [Chloroflexaceae bacterium]|nr:hypothetical protein [Chloroflexaceae bacterium]